MEVYLNERITDLRMAAQMTQQELAGKLEISKRTVVGMESDESPTNIPHTVLMRLSEIFEVSVDYLLGLTNVPCRDNATAENLGLSDTAIKVLMNNEISRQFLNHLLCSPQFIELANMADVYFEDLERAGYDKRNELFTNAISRVTEYKEGIEYPDKGYDKELVKIRSEIANFDKFQIGKLKDMFEEILIDIKSTYDVEPYMTTETEQKVNEIAEYVQRRFVGKNATAEQFTQFYVLRLKEAKAAPRCLHLRISTDIENELQLIR